MIEFVRDEAHTTSQSNYLSTYGIWYNDYNSAFLLNRNPEMPLYHKSKLVVAVENFPYQNILKPILGETLINLGGTVALKTSITEELLMPLCVTPPRIVCKDCQKVSPFLDIARYKTHHKSFHNR